MEHTFDTISDLDNSSIFDLRYISSYVLEQLVNNYLAMGLPIPMVKGISLVNPTIRVLDRTIEIGSDLSIDQEFISEFAVNAIRKGLIGR